MTQSDYPYLFQLSDSASLSEQKVYINLYRIDFALIVSAAFFSGFNLNPIFKICKLYALLALVALILSLILKLIIQMGKWDRKWYVTRAIAESVKKATWLYITGVEPYEKSMSSEDVDRKFINELGDILKSTPEAPESLSKDIACGEQISNRMRKIRQMNMEARKSTYLQKRIKDQKDWYTRMAKYNSSKETKWFWIIISVEFLAILAAIYILNTLNTTFNPIGTFATLVVVFSAWIQIKKHRELSQSYTLTAQELSLIESLAIHIKDEEGLSNYVRDAENAISKEHTTWCTKWF